MPIYEYQCQKCEHVLEALQKIAEEPLRFCPECGAEELKRLLSAPRFRLKGSGWYETDFKSENDKKRNLAGDESAADSKSSDKTSEKSADKSADKPADKPAEKSAEKSADKSADKPATKSAKAKAKPLAKAKPAAKSKAPARKSARR
jgi:putative FmdB family regulatory protein